METAKLGEFEEVVLLLVGILGDDAYALRLSEEYEKQTRRSASVGSVHSTLSRMADKGFLTSTMSAPSSGRGGRRKRIYSITALGEKMLRRNRDLRVSLWNQYPGLSLQLN